MDRQTAETQAWLDERYQTTTDDGVYFAHQNIYGFEARLLTTTLNGQRSGYFEPGAVLRYMIFWNIIRTLKTIRFESLLDVGGSEGYMSAAIRTLFGVRVRACDLSKEACRRAQELFNVDADTVDGVHLPYPDESYDVVLSSETIEHVPNYTQVLSELLRVARKAAIITVPHDGPEKVARNIKDKIPHAHLHDFTLGSLSDLVPGAYTLRAWGYSSTLLRLPYALVEGRPIDRSSRKGIKSALVLLVNILISLCRRLTSETMFRMTLGLIARVDPFLATQLKTYRGVVFLIIKQPGCLAPDHHPGVKFSSLLDFKVPLYAMRLQQGYAQQVLEANTGR